MDLRKNIFPGVKKESNSYANMYISSDNFYFIEDRLQQHNGD